jgi:hypothetical protein
MFTHRRFILAQCATVYVLAMFESCAFIILDISGAGVDHRHCEDVGIIVVFSAA